MNTSSRKLHDTIVVGAGIAGLAAAMQAAFENKKVLLIEGSGKPGGQGGSTNAIKNLFGFPNGITGPELVSRGLDHSGRYGVEFFAHKRAVRLISSTEGPYTILCEDRSQYSGRTVILACGLQHRHLGVPGEDQYVGRGVIHQFPEINNRLWEGQRVVVVGGGNSGAQCCLYLSQCNCEVDFVVRGPALNAMSASYVSQFAEGVRPKNIRLHLESEIIEIRGDRNGVSLVAMRSPAGQKMLLATTVVVMVGATPHTAWLEDSLRLTPHGFVYTDRDLPPDRWQLKTRKPRFCETELPGVFAAGDVRFGNEFRRAQSAMNDGAAAAAGAVNHLFELDFPQKNLTPVRSAS